MDAYAGDMQVKDKIVFLGPVPRINVKPEAEHGLPPDLIGNSPSEYGEQMWNGAPQSAPRPR